MPARIGDVGGRHAADGIDRQGGPFAQAGEAVPSERLAAGMGISESYDLPFLQEVIAALKGKDFGIDMQFDNYRSN